MDDDYFQRALDAYCEREAERAELFRAWRYRAEVQLIEDATNDVEQLLGLRIGLDDWTVRLHGSASYPRSMVRSAWGCATALIDPERALSLWYYPRKLTMNTRKLASHVLGVREYCYGAKRYTFSLPVRANADLGELIALPADFIDAARYVVGKYPNHLRRKIAFHEVQEGCV